MALQNITFILLKTQILFSLKYTHRWLERYPGSCWSSLQTVRAYTCSDSSQSTLRASAYIHRISKSFWAWQIRMDRMQSHSELLSVFTNSYSRNGDYLCALLEVATHDTSSLVENAYPASILSPRRTSRCGRHWLSRGRSTHSRWWAGWTVTTRHL